MSRQRNSESGFGLIVIALSLLVFAAVIAIAGYAYVKLYRSSPSPTHVVSTETKTTTAHPSEQGNFLKIPELGIQIKLTANTLDAYYSLTDSVLPNRPQFVHLAVHSLDAYQGCTASAGGGIAAIGAFAKGQTDEVVGDFMTAYPNAPKVGSFYYYVTGNQYDCTDGKASILYSNARHDFIDAYSSIEAISK